jgi:hypothetical protein
MGCDDGPLVSSTLSVFTLVLVSLKQLKSPVQARIKHMAGALLFLKRLQISL